MRQERLMRTRRRTRGAWDTWVKLLGQASQSSLSTARALGFKCKAVSRVNTLTCWMMTQTCGMRTLTCYLLHHVRCARCSSTLSPTCFNASPLVLSGSSLLPLPLALEFAVGPSASACRRPRAHIHATHGRRWVKGQASQQAGRPRRSSKEVGLGHCCRWPQRWRYRSNGREGSRMAFGMPQPPAQDLPRVAPPRPRA